MANEKDLLAGVNVPEDINNPTDTEKNISPLSMRLIQQV